MSCAVALANLDVFEREDVLENVARTKPASVTGSSACVTSRSSVTCAAPATSRRSSSCPTRTSDGASPPSRVDELLRGFLLPRFYEAGLIARADDRGDPVVQLAPPLVAGDAELDEITDKLRAVLVEATERFCA